MSIFLYLYLRVPSAGVACRYALRVGLLAAPIRPLAARYLPIANTRAAASTLIWTAAFEEQICAQCIYALNHVNSSFFRPFAPNRILRMFWLLFFKCTAILFIGGILSTLHIQTIKMRNAEAGWIYWALLNFGFLHWMRSPIWSAR